MSTIEIGGFTATDSGQSNPLGRAIAGVWQVWTKHRDTRRTLHYLRQADTRTLRDMGFEPAEIYGSRLGSIGEIHGDAWKGLDR
ncbi:MAG TPA: DUF1127 domain-containing protein [Devosia sp.]|nr:DUF1127 domain-containing protein [Devosia sp.]